MKFTIEALYMLHIFNSYSGDLPFLPLPMQEGESRKEALFRMVDKGFEDLKELGLIEDDLPTEACGEYGYYIKEYYEATYHCRIDLNYFYAPRVDEFQNMAVVIHQDEEGRYQIERTGSLVFLTFLMQEHPVLQGVDGKVKDYLRSQWEEEAYLRFIIRQGGEQGLRITVSELGRMTQDRLYTTDGKHLYEYDLERQLRRSLDSEQLKQQILDKLKVRVYDGG